MVDYNKTYDGAAKDAVQATINGADFDVEFNAISTMSATKADKVTPSQTNNVALLNSSGNLVDGGKGIPTGDIVGTTDTQTLTNKTISGGTISNSSISGGTVSNSSISGGTVSNSSISGGTISNSSISGGTVSGSTISGGTIDNAVIGGTTPAAGTFQGLTDKGGSAVSQAVSSSANVHWYLRDETGKNVGLLYWDRASDTIAVRNYASDGTATDNELIIGSNFINFGYSSTNPSYNFLGTGLTTIPNVDINSGNIDGTTIGATTPAAGTFQGLTDKGGSTVSQAVSSGANVHWYLRDETGKNAGLLYWDRASDTIAVRNYASDGTATDNELIIGSNFINFGYSSTNPSYNFLGTGLTTIPNVDINSGNIDGTTIGTTTAAAGTFTSLSANSATVGGNAVVTENGGQVGSDEITSSTTEGSWSVPAPSAYTVPKGIYWVWGSNNNVSLQAYINGNWRTMNSDLNATGSLVISDGTNVRFYPSAGTPIVYYRKFS